jgi:hypothetical protein
MLYNSLEFVYKKGIEAFNLLFNLLAFNKKLLGMLHGACFTFSRKESREASGRRRQKLKGSYFSGNID